MKIAISKLPNNPWWGTGVISYKDNPIMRDRVIPDQGLLIRERLNLINTMKNNKLDVVELSFPKELENNKYGHDYVFIRDTFISDLNGNALLLKFSQKNRNAESQIISGYLEKLDFKVDQLNEVLSSRIDILKDDLESLNEEFSSYKRTSQRDAMKMKKMIESIQDDIDKINIKLKEEFGED